MKSTLVTLLLILSFTALAAEKSGDKTQPKDIFHEVRDILR